MKQMLRKLKRLHLEVGLLMLSVIYTPFLLKSQNVSFSLPDSDMT